MRRQKGSLQIAAVFAAICLLSGALPCAAAERPRIRVACIGDSITWGYAMTNRAEECYPVQLQRLLGPGYEVRNFGVPGAGVYSRPRPNAQRWTANVWRSSDLARAAYAFAPDIVISNLGINNEADFLNEFKPVGNGAFAREPGTFRREYVALLEEFGRGRATKPRLVVWTRLAPLSKNHPSKGSIAPFVMAHELDRVAADVGAEALDMYAPLLPYCETPHYAADGVHPEGAAQREIAVRTALRIRHGAKPRAEPSPGCAATPPGEARAGL